MSEEGSGSSSCLVILVALMVLGCAGLFVTGLAGGAFYYLVGTSTEQSAGELEMEMPVEAQPLPDKRKAPPKRP